MASRSIVDNNSTISRLLNHKRNENVHFSKKQECFYVKMDDNPKNGRPSRGLKTILAKTFFPDYNYKAVSTLLSREKKINRTINNDKSRGNGKKPRSSSRKNVPWSDVINERLDPTVGINSGIKRGTMTHDQLSDYVNLSSRSYIRKHQKDGVLEYTEDVIDKLVSWGINPEKGEFCVYDETLLYATAIDMVATLQRKRDKIILIEIKTGYKDTFALGNSVLRLPPGIPAMSNSPLHQAMLQILIARLTLKWRYGIRNTECLVIHVDDSGVHKHLLNKNLIKYEDEIYRFAYNGFRGQNISMNEIIDRVPSMSMNTPRQKRYTTEQKRTGHIRCSNNMNMTPASRATLTSTTTTATSYVHSPFQRCINTKTTRVNVMDDNADIPGIMLEKAIERSLLVTKDIFSSKNSRKTVEMKRSPTLKSFEARLNAISTTTATQSGRNRKDIPKKRNQTTAKSKSTETRGNKHKATMTRSISSERDGRNGSGTNNKRKTRDSKSTSSKRTRRC